MLDVLHQDYVRTAYAKGLGERYVVLKHALRNATIPALTVIGTLLATLLGGTVVIETVFNIPGMGRLVVQSVTRRDFQVVQGAVLMVATIEVKVVGIGSRLWVTDPRQAEETYIALEADTGIEELLNPDRLLLEAVAVIEEAEITGTDDIDGVATTKVEGVVDIRNALERAANGTPVPEMDAEDESGAGLLLDGELLIAVWIDENNLVRRLALGGPLTPAEDQNVIRQLDLSAFDEPVEIEEPPTA